MRSASGSATDSAISPTDQRLGVCRVPVGLQVPMKQVRVDPLQAQAVQETVQELTVPEQVRISDACRKPQTCEKALLGI